MTRWPMAGRRPAAVAVTLARSARARSVAATMALATALAVAIAVPVVAIELDGDPGARRVVAVGDVHGAYDALVAILRQARLIDDDNRWIGDDAILVQTGDLVDRGRRVDRVLDLMIELERQAPEQGGRVIVLLGNHELMNLLGDLRDVEPGVFERFADERSEMRRVALCHEHVERRKRVAKELDRKLERPAREERKACLAAHPPGVIEYWQAFGPEGRYGRWLRGLPTVARIGDLLFLHGGLSTELAARRPDELDNAIRAELAAFDQAKSELLTRRLIVETADLSDLRSATRALQESAAGAGGAELEVELPAALTAVLEAESWLSLAPGGPQWFRGYSEWTEEEGVAALPSILERQGARHLIVAHTPDPERGIRPRFEGRVFLIDTGMLAPVYKGEPAALEIRSGRFKAIYLGHEEMLPVDDKDRVAVSR